MRNRRLRISQSQRGMLPSQQQCFHHSNNAIVVMMVMLWWEILSCLSIKLFRTWSVIILLCGLLFVWCVGTISRCGSQTLQFCISQVQNQWDVGLLMGNHVMSLCPGLQHCLGHDLSPFFPLVCSLVCGNHQQMWFSNISVLHFTGPKPLRWLTSDGKSCHVSLS